jgi:hypothetical protein
VNTRIEFPGFAGLGPVRLLSGAGVGVGCPQRGCLGIAGTQAADGVVERSGAAAGLGHGCATCGEVDIEVLGDVAG